MLDMNYFPGFAFPGRGRDRKWTNIQREWYIQVMIGAVQKNIACWGDGEWCKDEHLKETGVRVGALLTPPESWVRWGNKPCKYLQQCMLCVWEEGGHGRGWAMGSGKKPAGQDGVSGHWKDLGNYCKWGLMPLEDFEWSCLRFRRPQLMALL